MFEPTGTKYTYAEVTFPISLNPGDVLSLKAPEGESEVAMIDYIMLETDESKIANQVVLDREELVFDGQDKEQLIATVLPETALVKSVSWMSSNTNVATVSDSGLVRPTGKGTAIITATLNGGTDTATCTVIVNELPAAGVYQNVALNKPATQNRNDNPETGNDGNTTANGPFSGGTPTAPAWWSVDLGGIYDISETKLYFKAGDRHDWFYKIEYSAAEAPTEDDPSWTILADYTQTAAPDIPGPHVETLEEPVQARHLRVTLTGIPEGSNYWYTFAEFEAYGTPAVIEDNEADVEAAVNALTWDVIKGGNADQESITADLVLPTEGENGTAIAWASDSTDVISDQGVVTRPAEEDRTVTLTATVTKGEASAVKTFTVTVLAATKPEPEQTPAPEFVQTTAQFPDEASDSVSFTLKNAAEAVYKVYAAADGGEALTEPAVTVEGETLTLTFAAQPDADTVYCISAAEADKTESVRTAVTVKPYVEEVEEVIPPVTEYIIKAEAEMGGTISPDGSVRVPSGGSKTFAIAANEGYEIADVLVDGVSVGAVSTYTFERVEKKHTIVARFKPAGGGETEGFGDVASGAWYAEAVAYVSDNGIMNGTSATTFAPEMTLTRSMMAQILYNLEKQPAVTSANPFSDVPAGQWYTNAVVWAAANDIVTGYNGKFQPDASITREQMAAILYRYAQYKGYDTSAKGSLENFSDAAAASDWANEALTWAVGEGILSGKGNGVLNPVGTAARAEVAAMLMRFCENIEK